MTLSDLNLREDNIVDRIEATCEQNRCITEYLKKDKSLFGAIYCKLIEIASYQEIILCYYFNRIKHYLLQDCIVTFKPKYSKLRFIENAINGNSLDIKNLNTIYIDVNGYDAQTGIQYFNYLIAEPSIPGVSHIEPDLYTLKDKKLIEKQQITDFDIFTNMFGTGLINKNLHLFILQSPYIAPYITKDLQIYKYINADVFNKITFTRDLSCRMMIRTSHDEIYSFDEIKNKLKDSHNHISFDPGDSLSY